MPASKGKTALVVVAVAAVLFVGTGVALAATKPRAQLRPIEPPPPPSLADDLRLVGEGIVRYGGKGVAAAAKATNRYVTGPVAKGLGSVYTHGARFLGFGSAPRLTPDAKAAYDAMAAQREKARKAQPLISGIGSRPPLRAPGAAGPSVFR